MDPGGFQHHVRAVRQGGPEDQYWEDSLSGLPYMKGVGNTVGGGVQETDDYSGDFLPG